VLIPDQLRPYAQLIRWGLWALLAGGLFVTGCNHGKDRQAAKDQERIGNLATARDRAQADADENLRAAHACGQLLSDINDQTQRQIDEAANAKRAAEQAASRAEAAAAAGQRRAVAAEKALQDAKSTPACRSQLEMPLCDAIPLL
jgi:hypothetical protein